MRDRDSEERMGSEIGKGGEKEIEGRKEEKYALRKEALTRL